MDQKYLQLVKTEASFPHYVGFGLRTNDVIMNDV
jgi:hypothetical protein